MHVTGLIEINYPFIRSEEMIMDNAKDNSGYVYINTEHVGALCITYDPPGPTKASPLRVGLI